MKVRMAAVLAVLVIGAGLGYTFYARHQQERKEATIAATASKHTAQKHAYAELQPLLDNRCFRSKTADVQKEWLERIDAAPEVDFKKTMSDLDIINASDRLLGTQGCETPK